MVMMNVDSRAIYLGKPDAWVNWLVSKVTGRTVLFCTYHMNELNIHNGYATMTALS